MKVKSMEINSPKITHIIMTKPSLYLKYFRLPVKFFSPPNGLPLLAVKALHNMNPTYLTSFSPNGFHAFLQTLDCPTSILLAGKLYYSLPGLP